MIVMVTDGKTCGEEILDVRRSDEMIEVQLTNGSWNTIADGEYVVVISDDDAMIVCNDNVEEIMSKYK